MIVAGNPYNGMSSQAIEVRTNAVTLPEFVATYRRLFVLTGAGCSTDSGIPDYRDANGSWKRPQPMTYQAFVGHIASGQSNRHDSYFFGLNRNATVELSGVWTGIIEDHREYRSDLVRVITRTPAHLEDCSRV